MIILEIIQIVFQSFLGTIEAVILSIPSIIELKECFEIFTPSGFFVEFIKYLGIPTIVILLITVIVKIFKKIKI